MNFGNLETFAVTLMEGDTELATNTLLATTELSPTANATSTGVYNYNRETINWKTEVHVDTETWTAEYAPNKAKYTYTIDGIKYEQILDIASYWYGGDLLISK